MTVVFKKRDPLPSKDQRLVTGRGILGWTALFSLVLFLRNPELTLRAMSDALRLCAHSLIPALFPCMVLSEVIVGSDAARVLGRLLRRPMDLLFGVSQTGASAVFLGFLCGFPVGVRSVLSLYQRGCLDQKEAERLLSFCNAPSPAFLVSTVGVSLFGSRSFGWRLYGITLLSALITGILSRPSSRHPSKKRKGSSPLPLHRSPRDGRGLSLLSQAVQSSALSMMKLCAFVVFFSTFVKAIESLLSHGAISPLWLALLLGLWEMTGGVVRSATLPVHSHMVCAALIGWSGVSVHLQTVGLCDESSLSLRPYFFGRLLQALLNPLLLFLTEAAIG